MNPVTALTNGSTNAENEVSLADTVSYKDGRMQTLANGWTLRNSE